MANIKISQLPAKGANLEADDLLEVSEFTGTGYVSKSITGQEIIDAASGGGGVNPTTNTFPYNNGGVFADSALKIYPDTIFGTGVPFGIYNLSNPVFGGSPNLRIDDFNTLYSFGQANATTFGIMSAYAGIAIRQGGFIMGCSFASPFDGVFRADVSIGYITIGTNDATSIGVDTTNNGLRIGTALTKLSGPSTIAKYVTVTDELNNTYYLHLYQ